MNNCGIIVSYYMYMDHIVSEINMNLLAYLFTRMHPETRFNPETVATISPCFSFAENAQSFVNA